MTVKELKEQCEKLIKMGLSDKKILISSDDELNEFHTLWDGFVTDIEDIHSYEVYSCFHDGDSAKDVVLLK